MVIIKQNNPIDIKAKKQMLFSFTAVYMLSFLCLLNCINAISSSILGIRTSLDTMACYGVLILCVALSAGAILFFDNIKADVLLLFFFMIAMFVVTDMFQSQNLEYINTSWRDYANNSLYILFVYAMPAYALVRYLDDLTYFEKYLRIFSYVVVSLSIIIYFFAADSFANQYMTLSYNMLLQLFYLTLYPPKNMRILHYVFVGVGLFVLVFGGARGALVGFMSGLAFHIFFRNEQRDIKIFKIVLLVIGAVVVSLFYSEMLMFLDKMLEAMGIESRTLDSLMYADTDVSSGRFGLYQEIVQDYTALGNGLFSDRELLGGRYVHNMFLEWLSNYGLIVGTGFILMFILIFFGALRNNKNQYWKYLMLLIPNGVIGMMFSGSYLLQSPWFYAMLGMCVNTVTVRKKKSLVRKKKGGDSN